MIRVTQQMIDALREHSGIGDSIMCTDSELAAGLVAALAQVELVSSRELETRWNVGRAGLAQMINRRVRNGMPAPVFEAPGGWRVWQADVLQAWRESYTPVVGAAARPVPHDDSPET